MTEKLRLLIEATDKASKPMGKVGDSLDNLDKKSGIAGKGMGALKGVMGGLAGIAGGALVAGLATAATAVAVVGGSSFKLSADIQASQGEIQAQLGATQEEAEELSEVAKNVFGNNFGNNFKDASDAVIETRRQIRGLADEDLQLVAEGALAIRDAFDVDVNQTTQAAGVLMEKFGVTSDEAMDMLAKGFQNGLNNSGDFLDTINEYGGIFSEGGASAKEFFSLLETGQQSGVLGTDKIADSFKELNATILDGSPARAEALEAIGLNAPGFLKDLSTGKKTTTEAFKEIQKGLKNTEDESVRNQAAVALLGTMVEDMGFDSIKAIDLMSDTWENNSGSLEKVEKQYSSFGQMGQAIWRKILLAVEPFTTKILEIASSYMPLLLDSMDKIFDFVERFINPVFDRFAGLFDRIREKITQFQGESNPQLEELMANLQLLFEEFVAEVMPIIDQFFISLEAIWNKIVVDVLPKIIPTLNSLVEYIRIIMPLIMAIIRPIAIMLIQMWENVWTTVVGILSGMMTYFQGWVDLVAGIFTGDGQRIRRGFLGIFEGMAQIISSIFKGIFNQMFIQIEAGYTRAKQIANGVGLGGAIPNINFPRLNTGGAVKKNQPVIVGDAPGGRLTPYSELFVPQQNGRVYSASQTRSILASTQRDSSAGVQIAISINSNQDPIAIAQEVKRELRDELENENRYPRFT